MRKATIQRKTAETEITLKLNLDGNGQAEIDTGIGFLDHMLTHLAVHGNFDLELSARGDLEVDEHHTVEDCALALGQAFDQALKERIGITRMGSALVPMDEALVQIAVDLSGRPYSVIQIEWNGPQV
ncbi:MAG: imidazoleglycerol-phosphate dehydratase, partial [Anaerolineales bacterium]|nr:imidazoleglycerol-phosphate dehydratase [Anaerolineales bacterium]